MKHGFIKVAAASPRVTVADTDANASAVLEACAEADAAGVKLLVFPELSVTGATCGDLFLHRVLQDAAAAAIERIAAETAYMDMLIVIGAPLRLEAKLYDCAVFIHQGQLIGAVPKSMLTAAERRWFAPADAHAAPAGAGCAAVRIGENYVPFGTKLLISADGMPDLRISAVLGGDLYAPIPVSAEHALAGANVIVCLSAQPEKVGEAEFRRS
ncbi:MAG: NAD(+) synthase, partial [Clostridia bacterium]|nr:NAD(+) synthase [Clostridia bacterium]